MLRFLVCAALLLAIGHVQAEDCGPSGACPPTSVNLQGNLVNPVITVQGLPASSSAISAMRAQDEATAAQYKPVDTIIYSTSQVHPDLIDRSRPVVPVYVDHVNPHRTNPCDCPRACSEMLEEERADSCCCKNYKVEKVEAEDKNNSTSTSTDNEGDNDAADSDKNRKSKDGKKKDDDDDDDDDDNDAHARRRRHISRQQPERRVTTRMLVHKEWNNITHTWEVHHVTQEQLEEYDAQRRDVDRKEAEAYEAEREDEEKEKEEQEKEEEEEKEKEEKEKEEKEEEEEQSRNLPSSNITSADIKRLQDGKNDAERLLEEVKESQETLEEKINDVSLDLHHVHLTVQEIHNEAHLLSKKREAKRARMKLLEQRIANLEDRIRFAVDQDNMKQRSYNGTLANKDKIGSHENDQVIDALEKRIKALESDLLGGKGPNGRRDIAGQLRFLQRPDIIRPSDTDLRNLHTVPASIMTLNSEGKDPTVETPYDYHVPKSLYFE